MGELPIDEGLSRGGDAGVPLVLAKMRGGASGEGEGGSSRNESVDSGTEEVRRVFQDVAEIVWRRIS